MNEQCPIHNKPLEQINIRFQVVGFCRECHKEYYKLPDGKIVDRKEWYEIKEAFNS